MTRKDRVHIKIKHYEKIRSQEKSSRPGKKTDKKRLKKYMIVLLKKEN